MYPASTRIPAAKPASLTRRASPLDAVPWLPSLTVAPLTARTLRVSTRAASTAPKGTMMATSCAARSAALVSRKSATLATIATASTWSTRLISPKNRRATRSSAQPTTITLARCRNARASQMPLSPA